MNLLKICPKLPVSNKNSTKQFYLKQLKFTEIKDYGDYIILQKDEIEIHFFLFKALDPKENYGQVYIRTKDIDRLYQNFVDEKVEIHPYGKLEIKSWGQKEFSLLDPDSNLLTFGQNI